MSVQDSVSHAHVSMEFAINFTFNYASSVFSLWPALAVHTYLYLILVLIYQNF
jgi:hypothetical protein